MCIFDENNEIEYKMVAPDIDRLLEFFDRRYLNPTASTERLISAMEPLFETLDSLAPYPKNNETKVIWLRIPRGPIDDYDSYEDMKEWGEVKTYEEYLNRWQEDYPDEYKWYRLVVVRVINNDGSLRFYGMLLNNEAVISASLDGAFLDKIGLYEEDSAVKLCKIIVPAVRQSMSLLKEGKYNEIVDKELPYWFRTGVIKRSDLWDFVPGNREWVYDGLTEEQVELFEKQIESGINNEDRIGRIKEFTANDFFKACKLGYEAIGKDCEGYSLPELYMHYSDGRDEGLTGMGHGLNEGDGINPDSPKAWDEWYFNSKRGGGHPWEVVPGGSSTHMSLYVSNDKKDLEWKYRLGEISEDEYKERLAKAGYYFCIGGLQRQYETVCFYLALSSAGLPVIVYGAEELIARFDGADYVGVVPHHVITRYCDDLFPEEYDRIIDFTHVYKEEDKWFDKITWLQEEPAKMLRG